MLTSLKCILLITPRTSTPVSTRHAGVFADWQHPCLSGHWGSFMVGPYTASWPRISASQSYPEYNKIARQQPIYTVHPVTESWECQTPRQTIELLLQSVHCFPRVTGEFIYGHRHLPVTELALAHSTEWKWRLLLPCRSFVAVAWKHSLAMIPILDFELITSMSWLPRVGIQEYATKSGS